MLVGRYGRNTLVFNYKQAAAETLARGARKISRSQQRMYVMRLLKEQNGNCAVCGRPISLGVMGNKSDYVLDHCHDTGLVRGVLHRGCNGALGKAENAIACWSGVGGDMDNIINWMRGAIAYYEKGFQPVIYPDHKTKEEKAALAAQKRKVEAARKKIAAKLKEQK